MAIELSSLTFTEQDDVVPASGEEQIFNSGITNTLAGNDIIYGTDSYYYGNIGLGNYLGVINTGDGDDTLIGDGGIYNSTLSAIETGADDDKITASGNDDGIDNDGIIDTGDGHDIITGYSWAEYDPRYHFPIGAGISNRWASIIDTGNGNDTINGSGNNGINNSGSINMGNGEDFISSEGEFNNYGGVFLGEGNDSLFSSHFSFPPYPSYHLLANFNFIGTGDGNDMISSFAPIYNQGVIETGNGNDSIIVFGSVNDSYGDPYNFDNNGGTINMGDGNDSIDAYDGFRSGPNSSGAWFLGEGDDYIKGHGSGDFYGGNGNDTLELPPGSYIGGNGNDLIEITSGTYTVGRWDTSVIFTQGDRLMITSEFEKLKAGSTIYDFTSLTAGQIIVAA